MLSSGFDLEHIGFLFRVQGPQVQEALHPGRVLCLSGLAPLATEADRSLADAEVEGGTFIKKV